MIIKVVVDATKLKKELMRIRDRKNPKEGESDKVKNIELILIPCNKGSSHYIVAQSQTADEEKVNGKLPIIGNGNEMGPGARAPMGDGSPPANNESKTDEVPW